jgi:hypothetical protein
LTRANNYVSLTIIQEKKGGWHNMLTLVLVPGYFEPTWYVRDGSKNIIGMLFMHIHPPFSDLRDYYTANLIGQMVTDLANKEGRTIFYSTSEALSVLESAVGSR